MMGKTTAAETAQGAEGIAEIDEPRDAVAEIELIAEE